MSVYIIFNLGKKDQKFTIIIRMRKPENFNEYRNILTTLEVLGKKIINKKKYIYIY